MWMGHVTPKVDLMFEFCLDGIILDVGLSHFLLDDLHSTNDLLSFFDGDGFFDNTISAESNRLADDVVSDRLSFVIRSSPRCVLPASQKSRGWRVRVRSWTGGLALSTSRPRLVNRKALGSLYVA
ncbi:hypothetical protein ABW21_db0208391 [Orbilia brochopaga]|nr:hypothetical protein ABW21_db0208391 [Drechslerella brochopaga]